MEWRDCKEYDYFINFTHDVWLKTYPAFFGCFLNRNLHHGAGVFIAFLELYTQARYIYCKLNSFI